MSKRESKKKPTSMGETITSCLCYSLVKICGKQYKGQNE